MGTRKRLQPDLIENRQIRIFISSTFKDMMPERDYLINKIFPELKRYCQERDVTLFELDLRWGVSEEESKQGRTVEICLEEIENTHPFFIGILGERYGWTLTEEEQALMKANTRVFETYPWITDMLSKGTSITEIEIQHGVLRSDENLNAHFYFRSPEMETPAEFREKEGSIEAQKLKNLKKEICEQKKYPIQNYTSIEDLGKQVEHDFKALVDKLFPQGVLSELEKERLQQKAFLKSRTGVYIANPAYMAKLDAFVKSNSSTLVITGKSGIGKSALIANWIQRRKKQSDEHLIYYSVSNSESGGDYRKITQWLINEIESLAKNAYMRSAIHDFSGEKDKSKKKLEELLFSIENKGKLLIVLDDVNQLMDVENAKRLNWLPTFPKNVKIIYITRQNDKTMEVFQYRGYETLVVQPLNRKERKQLTTEYLKVFGKSLLPEQVNRIATEGSITENTLVLRTFLEEIRVFGKHEEVDKRINNYLSAKDIESFFDRMLERIEVVYSYRETNFVKDVFSLIAVSRVGLSETTLLELTGAPLLYWSQLFNAISIHLETRNRLITFSHQFLRDAVQKRYLFPKEKENKYREQIVIYLKSSSADLQYNELPHQLYEMHAWDELYTFLLDFDVFEYIYDKDKSELGKYWKGLVDADKEKYSTRKYLDIETPVKRNAMFDIHGGEFTGLSLSHITIVSDISPPVLVKLYCKIGQFFSTLFANDELSFEYYIKTLNILENISDSNHPNTAVLNNNIGIFYAKRGDYLKAFEYFQKATIIVEKELDANHPNRISFRENLNRVLTIMNESKTSSFEATPTQNALDKTGTYYNDILKPRVMNLLNNGEISKAEDLLFENLETNFLDDIFEIAYEFYKKLRTYNNAWLVEHNFSTQEVEDGWKDFQREFFKRRQT
ncbi:MAG: DUF6483 family protein [Candidatus Symbiothrix sp.]|jgi:hypothetical protein|nr:DUF6483 family protein [Candidatus Symbiothrix sp.]